MRQGSSIELDRTEALTSMLLILAVMAWVPPMAVAASEETIVEPAFTDCNSTAIYPQMFNGPEKSANAASQAVDLDGDDNVGTAENTDADDVFLTIDEAVDSTRLSAGGVTQLLVPGIYRENIGIDQSLTLRAPAGTDVTIEGGAGNCDAPSLTTGLDIDIASGETVVLENLTIRGYTIGIDLQGSTGGTLIVRNCRFQDNTTAIKDDGGGAEIHIFDSFFVGGSHGVSDPNGLTVVNTTFTGHAQNAVEGDVAVDWRFVGSTISNCGGIGLSGQGAQTGTHVVELFETRVIDNGGSGVDIDGAKVTFTMNRSTVSGNAGDGVRLKGQTGSVFAITDSVLDNNDDDGLFVENTKGCTGLTNVFSGAVMGSRIAVNGSDGIEIGGTGTGCSLPNIVAPVECGLLNNALVGNAAYGIKEATATSSFHCGVGVNMISYNASGAESGTGGVCTSLGTSQNQVN